MSDAALPVNQIKTEPNTDDDIEEKLPVYRVCAESKLIHASVEIVDLTEEDFLNEFKCFLNTLPDRRLDVEARRTGTNAKARTIRYVLAIPALLLAQVRIHQDTFICELFRINFSNTMLYGKLTAETFRNDVTVYQLDDGSATVDVYYRPSNNKMLDNLNKLLCCEDTLRRKPSPLNEEAIPSSIELRHHLRMLISIAKARCATFLGRLKLRTQCFVVGRPFEASGGRVAVFAQTILPDGELGHSCELFWKCYLLSVYEPMLSMSEEPTSMNETTASCIDKLMEKMKGLYI
uniref:Uncharacterized protein n=1 Tax=Anopheles quadriannulatus TaxID=34691 RepID=A0A182XLK0_ANOQN